MKCLFCNKTLRKTKIDFDGRTKHFKCIEIEKKNKYESEKKDFVNFLSNQLNKLSINNMNKECSICYELTDNVINECGHFNCFNCLRRVVKYSNLCPICRCPFSTEKYKYIPPKHKPNIPKKTLRFFNQFINNRYLLNSRKRIHRIKYADLMYEYHKHILYNGIFISLDMIYFLKKHTCLGLYVYLSKYSNVYNNHTTHLFQHRIYNYLCNDCIIIYQ